MKLTSSLLRKIIEEEVKKFGEIESTEERAKDTEEVDAEDLADTLVKQIDFIKALKIEEGRLRTRLGKIAEQRQKILRQIKKS